MPLGQTAVILAGMSLCRCRLPGADRRRQCGHRRAPVGDREEATAAKGFEVIPRRWMIERTFGWLTRNRRLAKDFERLIETSTAMAIAAVIQLLVRRLANG